MRVFDTLLFDGEFDLLQHRIAETQHAVDVYVLIESTCTFQGDVKRASFGEHRERFAWLGGRLRHVALHSLGAPDSTSWQREALQRNAIMLGLRDAEAGDVVLLLDADEIVNRETLLRLRGGLDRPTRLGLTRHYEYGDLVAPRSACCVDTDAPFAFDLPCVMPSSWSQLDERWCDYSGIAVRFRDLSGDPATGLPPRSAYDLRRLAHAAPRWANAGRHFVGVDPATTLERKLARVSHTEWSDHRTMAAEHLRRVRYYAVHHHGWWYAQRPRGELPADIARLEAGSPVALRRVALPPMLLRRMARTWAWLRFCAALPDSLVGLIDRHFELLLPLLAPVLGLAGLLRRLAAWRRWKWWQIASAATVPH